MVKVHFHTFVQFLRSYNTFELGASIAAADFLASQGILHQTTIINALEQNEVVERKYRHLLEVSRALLFQSELPVSYWGECVLTATYLIDKILSSILNNTSSFEKLQGFAPSYDHLRSFGFLCFSTTQKVSRDKFHSIFIPSLFFGNPAGKKGYKFLSLDKFTIFFSRNVVFHKHIFPSTTSHSPPLFPDAPYFFVDCTLDFLLLHIPPLFLQFFLPLSLL